MLTLSPTAARQTRELRRYLNEADAAAYIGMSPRFLESRRQKGTGPAHIRVSARCIRYDVDELDRFMAERMRTSTSDQGDAA